VDWELSGLRSRDVVSRVSRVLSFTEEDEGLRTERDECLGRSLDFGLSRSCSRSRSGSFFRLLDSELPSILYKSFACSLVVLGTLLQDTAAATANSWVDSGGYS
jgi:hypothetical protein